MRNLLAFGLLWVGLIVQSTLFQIPPINVVNPNLPLVVLILAALTRGPRVALILGVAIGFVQDANFGSFLGLNAFVYGVLGYFSATAFSQFLQRNISIAFLMTVCCTFIYDWMTFALTRLFDVTAFSWTTVLSRSIWQMIVNGIVVLLLYAPCVRWLTNRPRNRYRRTNLDKTELT